MAFLADCHGHALVDEGEDVGLMAVGAGPDVVVDRADAFFGVLSRCEVIVVVDLVDFYHPVAAIGAFARAVAPVSEQQQQRQ